MLTEEPVMNVLSFRIKVVEDNISITRMTSSKNYNFEVFG